MGAPSLGLRTLADSPRFNIQTSAWASRFTLTMPELTITLSNRRTRSFYIDRKGLTVDDVWTHTDRAGSITHVQSIIR
jgi:hypothetical protein